MSSHCSNYPKCNCPSDMGRYCGLSYPIDEIISLNNNTMVLKTDGKGVEFPVENPERFNIEDRKIKRRTPTNFTPKKKKRKKR